MACGARAGENGTHDNAYRFAFNLAVIRKAARIVLVGRRQGAVRAAQSLGLGCHVIDSSDSPDPAAGLHNVNAVVAVTEAAVVPAASLASRLGARGISKAVALRCTDKLEMKRAIRAAGLPCADFVGVVGRLDKRSLAAAPGFPLVLKTRTGSGGRDARIVHTPTALPEVVDRPHIAEAFIDGIEMSVESFVVDGEPVFVNLTDYVEPRWANLVPAVLDTDVAAVVVALNRAAIQALGVEHGMTHLEVFLTDDGPVFGELAARPPGGLLMRLIELAYGFDPWAALIRIALGECPSFPATAQRAAGVRFLHPGQGIVEAVDGLERLRALATYQSTHCRLKPGDVVGRREGTGQHTGYVVLAGGHDRVRQELETVRRVVRIDMRRCTG